MGYIVFRCIYIYIDRCVYLDTVYFRKCLPLVVTAKEIPSPSPWELVPLPGEQLQLTVTNNQILCLLAAYCHIHVSSF